MMAIARTLSSLHAARNLYLFDTFEGMSEPTEADTSVTGQRAVDALATEDKQTSWKSTYHELVHLYPRLSVGVVLIIDDYGHWEGARKAVDRFLGENNLKLLLSRIDYTGRIAVKLEA